MPAPALVDELVRRFLDNEASYRGANYKEDQLRQEFLNPFFECLGWDMANREGHAPAYRDVIHEDSVIVDGQAKAPDYSFRIGEVRKFFIEAKKPAVQIARDPDSAYQLRRYAWSAKLPVSILTNFGELAVYDCSKKPDHGDKAATGRIEFICAKDYVEKWDWLYGHFSKQAILKGSFDKYAVGNKGRRGTAAVDGAFLDEIEGWRELLAVNFAKKNAEITQVELNYAVQVTIDRIIFLRMCEDRGMETYGRLKELTEGTGVYRRLQQLFALADDRYNSGLFHFSSEKDRGQPDKLTHTLALDDKPLKQIFKGLYYPESPYVFNVMPADILGQVYEQFLGKVIRLTPGHVAKVEEKPEVKKAGGVYYTPTYIVEYIVWQTVGKLLDGATAETASKLRILDPACGSGSFLLVAYDFLLKWYLKWYVADGPEKHGKVLVKVGDRDYRLTTAEKKRILIGNIYGVDIDTQAVEVTKLSLLLKVLEGETDATLKSSPKLTGERVLPDLDKNILCGNSLIGPEIRGSESFIALPEADQSAIVPFDWKSAFKKVFKAGGFDAVIGNPPYIRIQILKEWAPVEVELYKEYASAQEGNYDIYVVFLERGLQLLSKRGRLGYICPNKFFNARYGRPIRSIIADGKHLAHAVHFGDQQVFGGATTYTALVFLDKEPAEQCHFVKVAELDGWRNGLEINDGTLKADEITDGEWNFTAGDGSALLKKLHALHPKLGDVADLFVGLQTSADKIYVVDLNSHIEEGITKPFLLTGDLSPYSTIKQSAKLIFPYYFVAGRPVLIGIDRIKADFPRGYSHLLRHRQALQDRDNGKMVHADWHAYVYPKNLVKFDLPKLIIQVTANRPTVLLDEQGLYMTGGGSGPFYGIRPKRDDVPIKYLMSILNSKLFGYVVKAQSTNLRGGYFKFSKQYIENAPILIADKLHQDRLIASAERMLALHIQLKAAKTPHEAASLQSQIDATDARIDALVYELYGLTAEEIAIVEASTTRVSG